MRPEFGRTMLMASSAFVCMIASQPALAQERAFDIPAQSLQTALMVFGRQGDVEILASRDVTRGKQTTPVHGQMTAPAALKIMLEGTGLVARASGLRTYTILAAPDGAPTSSAALAPTAAASTPPAAEAPTAAPAALGEVIVTAQHRTENLQHAAIAVDVVQGGQLVAAGVTQVDRLGDLAPALTVQGTSTGNILFMRGVGNFTVSPNSDPAIAFNYDGVYIGRPTSTTGMFYDLERVEVLKGPQGTLYGRNATGGALNILPAQPKLGQYSGYATVSYGDYNAVVAEGAVNLPIGDKAAVRVSASTADHDGYLKDGGQDNKTSSFRIQGKAELTPDLKARVSFDYSHTGGMGDSVSQVGAYSYNPSSGKYVFTPSNLPANEGVFTPAAQAFRETVTAGTAGRKLDALGPKPYQDDTFYGANAQVDYSTDVGTFTLVPAWRFSKPTYLSDAAAFEYEEHETDQQESLEGRFAGKRISIFDYNVGGYYYHEQISNQTVLTLSSAANWINEGFTTSSYAFFGRVTAHVTDRLRLVGGVRYTDDDKGFHAGVISGAVVCRAAACPNASLIPLVDAPSELPFAFPPSGVPALPQGTSGAITARSDSVYKATLANNNTSYHGGVEYDLAPQSLLYATVESGYRSGGFSAAAGFQTYQPEYLTAYTIGAKNRFFGNRLQLNFEGFLWNYTNQQISHVGLDLSGRSANFTQNIGSSRIEGAEVEGRLLVTDVDLVSADVQYLNTKTLSFVYQQGGTTPPLTGCASSGPSSSGLYTVNCSGMPNYNSPTWTLNLAAQHTFKLDEYKIVLGADTQYKTSRYVGFYYLPSMLVGPTWQSNAQVMFAPDGERWSVSLFVRNLENSLIPYYSSLHPQANILIEGVSPPRTYGVRLAAKF